MSPERFEHLLSMIAPLVLEEQEKQELEGEISIHEVWVWQALNGFQNDKLLAMTDSQKSFMKLF